MSKEFQESLLVLACLEASAATISIFRSPRSRLLSRPVSRQHFTQQVSVNPRPLCTNLDTVLARLRARLVIIEAALRVLPTGNSSNNNTLVGCWHVRVCQQIRVDSLTIFRHGLRPNSDSGSTNRTGCLGLGIWHSDNNANLIQTAYTLSEVDDFHTMLDQCSSITNCGNQIFLFPAVAQ